MARSGDDENNQLHEAAVSSSSASNLPHEIIVEILSRLPVKSVFKFRCVSKSWLSLLSSLRFAKTHLDLASRNNTLRQRLIFWSLSNICVVDWESINDDDVSDRGLVAVEINHALKDIPTSDWNRVDIVGSCNGVSCISMLSESSDPAPYFLINPCIGESRRIPTKSGCLDPVMQGFGSSSESDDYKLVTIDGKSSDVTLYSLRSDTWRRIATSSYHFVSCNSGVVLNGSLHWVGSVGDDRNRNIVVSFDLKEEAFWEMPFPAQLVEADLDGYAMSAGVLNECLCVHYRFCLTDHFYLMREYNNGESWTRINFSLDYVVMKPLGLAKNGDALLKENGELFLCNFEDSAHKRLVVHGIPVDGDAYEVDTCVETLVSPIAYAGIGRYPGRSLGDWHMMSIALQAISV